MTTNSTEETFLQDFQVVLKPPLQNYLQILKNSLVMYVTSSNPQQRNSVLPVVIGLAHFLKGKSTKCNLRCMFVFCNNNNEKIFQMLLISDDVTTTICMQRFKDFLKILHTSVSRINTFVCHVFLYTHTYTHTLLELQESHWINLSDFSSADHQNGSVRPWTPLNLLQPVELSAVSCRKRHDY